MGDDIGYSYHSPRISFMFKVRQIRSHINDVFSKFGKYIAPAYHHDRCERSVQMRLYSMHKREFILLFVLFFAILGLAIFIGLVGPPITKTVVQRASTFIDPSNQLALASGPYLLKSPALTTYDKQLWVIAKIVMDHKEEQFFRKDFILKISVEGISAEKNHGNLLMEKQTQSRNRTLSCDETSCREFNILHFGFIEYTHFILNATFVGLENLHQWATIKDVLFYFKTYDPSFTRIEIWVRFLFLLTTFVVLSWFAHALRPYVINDWSLEQKWMSALLPLLLLYNDPLFPMVFLVNSWVITFLDTVFQTTFICAVLLFWLSIYHGLRQTDRSYLRFYMPKAIIVVCLWFSIITISTLQSYRELKDPLFSADVYTHHFHSFKLFFFATGTIYVLYLVYFIITAYSELRCMPYFDIRLRFVTTLMTLVVLINVIITLMHYGIGAMEDNFVSDLSTSSKSSAKFMCSYGLMNIFMFISAYAYASSGEVILDSHILKDNPAFSMTNDSDEETHYLSDDESRRPLNRNEPFDESD